jgi:2-keto-4-pentenoate hydratase/2-oxohepta-3-ene-1,7-dioic acid hydratase in catechol pathway
VRLAVFDTVDAPHERVGLVTDGDVVPMERLGSSAAPPTLSEVIRRFDEVAPDLAVLASRPPVRGAGHARLRAPLAAAAKLLVTMRVCTIPGEPRELHLYIKAPSSVLGHGGRVVLPALDGVGAFTHNGCVAIVIGRQVHDLPPDAWRSAVFGYTAMIDVTARTPSLTRWKDGRSCLGGSCDTFSPLGPWIVPAVQVDERRGFAVRLHCQGELRQEYVLGELDVQIGEVLAFASRVMTLYPGDVIALQGPAEGQGPLQHGDRVRLEIDQIGTLQIDVEDRLQRRWPRDLAVDARADDVDLRSLLR